MRRYVKASIQDFMDWYDSLPSRKQAEVDDLADDMGLPLYDECTDGELAQLHDCIVSNPVEGGCSIKASYDPTEADTYVVKISYETDPGYDVASPQAAEEIIEVVANSPQQAKEYALMQWDGSVDRIEIIDVNPEEDEYEEIPFEACSNVSASSDPYAVGGHLKHYIRSFLAPHDVETGTVITNISEFESILKDEAGFDDIDDDELNAAFELYQDRVAAELSEIINGCSSPLKEEKGSKRSIKSNSYISEADYIRGVLADYLDDGTLTKKQYDDAIKVTYDIGGDDVSCLVEGGYLDDADKIKSIRYISDKTLAKLNERNDTLYDGGYIFRYHDGTVEWYGFFASDDDIYFIMSNE